MKNERNGFGTGGRRPIWTLRLAGPQDDADRRLWPANRLADSYGPAEMAALLWRRKAIAAAVFAAVVLPAAYLVTTAPPVYESALRLLVKGERVASGADAGRPAVGSGELTSEIEMIRSRDLLRAVVVKHSLADPGGAGSAEQRTERAVRDFERKVRVGAVPESALIEISLSHRDPKIAVDVVNSLGELYLEKHTAMRRNQEALDFFAAQAEHYRAELESAQAALTQFRRANQVTLLEAQKQASVSRGSQLEADGQDLESRIRDAEMRAGMIERQLAEIPAKVLAQSRSALNEPLIQQLKSLLVELRNQRAELLSRYEPTYRLVVEADRKIAQTEESLARAQSKEVVDETETINPLRQTVEADYLRVQSDLAGLRARRSELRGALDSSFRRQSRLESLSARDAELERAVRLAEENFLRYRAREEEARIENALDGRRLLSVSVFEAATLAVLPANGHRGVLLALAVLAALCAAAAAAVVFDRFDRPLVGVSEIAGTVGAPLLIVTEETAPHVS